MEPAEASVTSRSCVNAKALVIRSDGKVLVLRRSPSDPDSPGRLDLPGGGIDPGESYAEAIVREIREESGVAVSANEPTLAYTFTRYDDSSDLLRIRLLYAVRVSNPDVRLSYEHDMFWWHTPEELLTLFADISWGEAIRALYEHGLVFMGT